MDVTLVEGAVSNEEDLHRIRMVRSRTKILVSLGDCAVTGNVPAMRNKFGADAVLRRAYLENVALGGPDPARGDSRAAARASGRFTSWFRWMCSCPAARPPPT